MPLSSLQLRFLRGLAHNLKPIVFVGQKGVTPPVLAELDAALTVHELVKLKLAAGDREARLALAGQLAERSGAELVQRIGHVVCLYRRHPEKPRLVLP